MDMFPSRGRLVVWALLLSAVCVTAPNVARAQAEIEPNNDVPSATVIPTDGTVFSNTFGIASDFDYFRFDATLGMMYTITTSNLAGVNTAMDLIDADGFTMLDFNADAVPGFPESEIVYIAAATATYYFVVYEESFTLTGGYDLSVTASVPPPGEIEPKTITSAPTPSPPTARCSPTRSISPAIPTISASTPRPG